MTNLKYIKQDCIHSKMDMDMTWCGIPSHHDSLQRLILPLTSFTTSKLHLITWLKVIHLTPLKGNT